MLAFEKAMDLRHASLIKNAQVTLRSQTMDLSKAQPRRQTSAAAAGGSSGSQTATRRRFGSRRPDSPRSLSPRGASRPRREYARSALAKSAQAASSTTNENNGQDQQQEENDVDDDMDSSSEGVPEIREMDEQAWTRLQNKIDGVLDFDEWVDQILAETPSNEQETSDEVDKGDTEKESEEQKRSRKWFTVLRKMQERYQEMSEYVWILDNQLRDQDEKEEAEKASRGREEQQLAKPGDETHQKPHSPVSSPAMPTSPSAPGAHQQDQDVTETYATHNPSPPESPPQNQHQQHAASMYDRFTESRKRQSSQVARQRMLAETGSSDEDPSQRRGRRPNSALGTGSTLRGSSAAPTTETEDSDMEDHEEEEEGGGVTGVVAGSDDDEGSIAGSVRKSSRRSKRRRHRY